MTGTVERDLETLGAELRLPHKVRTRVERFSACLWETASLQRHEIREVWERSSSHGEGPIMVTSCQRLEVYSTDDCDCGAPLQKEGMHALRHLAEVAAGLHSVVLGEAQILGQVRTAIQEAPAEVRPLAEVALAAARELRRETEFHSHSGHLLDRALSRAELPAQGRLLVIGAGAVGRLIAQRGREMGFDEVIIASRREPDAAWFHDGGFQFKSVWDMHTLEPVDVAVGCLGSEADELRPGEDLPGIRHLAVDLGTPRNFRDNGSLRIITIAEMIGPGNDRPHSDARRAALRERLHNILDRRLTMMSHDSGSPVGNMRSAVEQVRQRELPRIQEKHPDITPEALDAITRALINRIFHTPSQKLKQIDDPELARSLAELFSEDGSSRTRRPLSSAENDE